MKTPKEIACEVVPADSICPKTMREVAAKAARMGMLEALRVCGKEIWKHRAYMDFEAWAERMAKDLEAGCPTTQ